MKNEVKYNLKTVDEKEFIVRVERNKLHYIQFSEVIIKGKSCLCFLRFELCYGMTKTNGKILPGNWSDVKLKFSWLKRTELSDNGD